MQLPGQSAFDTEGFTLPSMLPISSNNNNLIQSPSNQELVNIGNIRGPMNLNLGRGIDNLPMNNVISGLSNIGLTQHPEGTNGSGNNSPLSDSGISVDNVSHSSGGNAAMMNAAAMAKLHNSQSKYPQQEPNYF